MAFQKARASYAGDRFKGILGLGVLAVLLGFFAMMALVFGLVLWLAPMLTALGAGAAVFAVLLIVAAICAISAAGRWRGMATTISDRKAGT